GRGSTLPGSQTKPPDIARRVHVPLSPRSTAGLPLTSVRNNFRRNSRPRTTSPPLRASATPRKEGRRPKELRTSKWKGGTTTRVFFPVTRRASSIIEFRIVPGTASLIQSAYTYRTPTAYSNSTRVVPYGPALAAREQRPCTRSSEP